MEWNISSLDEQESLIHIDYFKKKISVYTNRKSVGVRLERKLGEPSRTFVKFGKIDAVEYTRNLWDKDVAKFFSKILIIGNFQKQKSEETKSEEK